MTTPFTVSPTDRVCAGFPVVETRVRQQVLHRPWYERSLCLALPDGSRRLVLSALAHGDRMVRFLLPYEDPPLTDERWTVLHQLWDPAGPRSSLPADGGLSIGHDGACAHVDAEIELALGLLKIAEWRL